MKNTNDAAAAFTTTTVRALIRKARGKGLSLADAEDVVQDAIVKAIETFNPALSDDIIMHTKVIVYQIAMDAHRHRKHVVGAGISDIGEGTEDGDCAVQIAADDNVLGDIIARQELARIASTEDGRTVLAYLADEDRHEDGTQRVAVSRARKRLMADR